MPKKKAKKIKLKTRKAVVKRIKKTGTEEIMVSQAGQGHFNARESGKTTRGKRKSRKISKSIVKTIKNLT